MKKNTQGCVYLIPTTLGDHTTIRSAIPHEVAVIITEIDEFIVENERSARRYLTNFNLKTPISNIKLHVLNKHTERNDLSSYLDSIDQGKDIGIISEAGCPGIADPGSEIVAIAHSKGIRVAPLVGPSSILLALIASGLNGQYFSFVGYLPINNPERTKCIKELELYSYKKDQTQIFMEAPYRNQKLLEDIIKVCSSDTLLCLATDITLPTEHIKTMGIKDWKSNIPQINKRPTIFLIHKY
ncbi:MAG: SAM-dependent methyltransferase [Bacteroidetes bacterium]|nr:MAG: SAM-dependent methyltransferase [Bacteroidota bacterium]